MSELQQIQEEFRAHQLNDSIEFSKAVRERQEIKDVVSTIKDDIAELKVALLPLTEAYEGILFSKKFFMGIVSVVIAIAAIGGAIYTFLSWIRHG